MDNIARSTQTLVLKDRKILEIDGVRNVLAFGEDYLDVNTDMGVISIEGESLKIEELLQQNGKILVSGEIDGIYYKKDKQTKSLFAKAFK